MSTLVPCLTLRGYLQAISGLFISRDNPGGLTPKELDILTALIYIMREEETVSAKTRKAVAQATGHPTQVVTNYMKKLRDKGVLSPDNKPVAVLRESVITFKYAAKAEAAKNHV